VLAVFNRYFSVSDFDDIVTRFKSGISVEVGDMMPSANYERVVKQVDGLQQHINKVEPGASGPVAASVVEFMLEGLHLNKRLNKDRVGASVQYRG
jgi:magnesium chelatase subunit I